MGRKRKETQEEFARRERSTNSGQRKMELFESALNGDCEAIMTCLYKRGTISKEDFDEYRKIKEQHGD